MVSGRNEKFAANLSKKRCRMPGWAVRCFANARGDDLFDRDYRRQTPDVRAEFRATLSGLLAQEDITGWCRPNGFDRLTGKYRALGKLRFKVNNVQHRPLGFFGPERKTFTLLIWATERDQKFHSPNVRDTALWRMNQVNDNPERARECDL
jgi:hypothetical protein